MDNPLTRKRAALAAFFVCLLACAAHAQGGNGHSIWGDLKVDESQADEHNKPLSYDILLYNESGNIIQRQPVPAGGRYRFYDLPNGRYNLSVEVEGVEVARIRIDLLSIFKSDFQQDINLGFRARPGSAPGTVAADAYKRKPAAQKLYERGEEALTAKRYADAAPLFEQVVAADAQDFEAWLELGTTRLLMEKYDDAEQAYTHAAEARPELPLPLVNLGRLRVMRKNFDGAVETLTKAVALKPPNADANYLLGEAYLQLKKGSKAVPYLEEAARLGRADAHLRLATLYNAVGLKDRAAAEYEQYLLQKPDAPERKKMEEYIKENKKQ